MLQRGQFPPHVVCNTGCDPLVPIAMTKGDLHHPPEHCPPGSFPMTKNNRQRTTKLSLFLGLETAIMKSAIFSSPGFARKEMRNRVATHLGIRTVL